MDSIVYSATKSKKTRNNILAQVNNKDSGIYKSFIPTFADLLIS